ncbi:hypothetical protein Taro_008858 [Colocasia esculenta]|uniref:Serine-threonine/tyrosine-protein kinase catalytic domain-containing protein n=1 Tax=Colocasia esculenta TaxID=4460 RepID=A0A843U889_COLES|nr:hypothetical protein [Colocasia esculenta]
MVKLFHLRSLMTRGNQFLGGVPSELHDLSVLSESEVDVKLPSPNGASITVIGGNATIRRILQQSNMTNVTRLPPDSLLESQRSTRTSPPPLGDPTHNLSSPSLNASPSPNGTTSGTMPQLTPPNASAPDSPVNSTRTPIPSPSVPPSNSTPTPKSSGSSSKKDSRTKYMVMLVGVGLGIFSLVGLLVFCVYYQCIKVVTVKPWTTGLSGQLQKAFVTGVSQLKRSELETACEDFSNIIGSLSDCMLYKGTLSSGVEIAVASTLVTSAKDWSKHSESQFRKKIATLSKVNHKNFVNLLGYCLDEEPFTRMMVFEYAPHGTLFEHLHSKFFKLALPS